MKTILHFLLEKTVVCKWDLVIEDVEPFIARYTPSWDAVFMALVDAVLAKFSKSCIALKHPTGERSFTHLLELFQRFERPIQFVYCVRNPFDTYSSWKHRATSWYKSDHKESLPLAWSAIWLKSTQQVLDFKFRFPDLVKIVRFTDLLNDPIPFCESLCQFLNIESKPEPMLELGGFSPNSSFLDTELPVVQGGIVNVRARADRDLTEWEMDAIRVACGSRAAAFGYELGMPSKELDQEAILHDVAMEEIPTRELIRYGWRLMVRRAWSRYIAKSPACGLEVKDASTLRSEAHGA
jgi:hypothetical protein